MSKKLRQDIAYEQQFGHIPDDQLDRIEFILGKNFQNEKYNKDIQITAKRIKRIKRVKLKFTIWQIIRPSARPRANTTAGFVRMYVPHAQENGRYMANFIKEHNLPYINTPCTLNMTIYEKTPSSFSIKQKVLAELGIIRPWRRTGDFDNYAKGIADAIQHGMLEDDCLVMESTQKLYYSIKPHADIEIIYMDKHPDEILFKNRKKR